MGESFPSFESCMLVTEDNALICRKSTVEYSGVTAAHSQVQDCSKTVFETLIVHFFYMEGFCHYSLVLLQVSHPAQNSLITSHLTLRPS